MESSTPLLTRHRNTPVTAQPAHRHTTHLTHTSHMQYVHDTGSASQTQGSEDSEE